MLARIAQELLWLGRDLIRAEHTARMLDGAFHADVAGGMGGAGGRVPLSWEAVLTIIGAEATVVPEDGLAAETEEPPWIDDPGQLGRVAVVRLLTLDEDSPASIVSCIARARERARALRDVISTEMWEAVNSCHLLLGRYDLPMALQTGPYGLFQEVKERCALFWGLLDRTMLRDEGRSFLEAGGRYQEADMVLRMLRVAIPPGERDDELPERFTYDSEALALLHAVGGVQAYRRAIRLAPGVDTVTRFLLYDSSYPGSVAFSVQALRDALETADAQPRSSPPVLRLGRLIAELELQRRTPQSAGPIADVLARVQDELTLVEGDIDERYFAIAPQPVAHM